MAESDPVDKVIERANAPRSDDRHGHGIGNGSREFEVEPSLGTIAIHGGEENFTGTQRHDLSGIGNGIKPGRVPAPMGEYLPAWPRSGCSNPLGINGDHDALCAELIGGFRHELATVHGGRIDGNLDRKSTRLNSSHLGISY